MNYNIIHDWLSGIQCLNASPFTSVCLPPPVFIAPSSPAFLSDKNLIFSFRYMYTPFLFLFWGVGTPGDAQGLLLAVCSEIAPDLRDHMRRQRIKPRSILGQQCTRQTPYRCIITLVPLPPLSLYLLSIISSAVLLLSTNFLVLPLLFLFSTSPPRSTFFLFFVSVTFEHLLHVQYLLVSLLTLFPPVNI